MADGTKVDVVNVRDVADAMKVSPRAIRMRAAKEQWHQEERAVFGGMTKVYPLTSLPPDVRHALNTHAALKAAETTAGLAGKQVARALNIRDAVDEATAQRIREQGQAQAAALTGRAAERMQAKLDLLARLHAFTESLNAGRCQALDAFCDAYNSGTLNVPLSIRQHTGADLHPATLRRWMRACDKQGMAALAGGYGNRKGSGAIDSDPDLKRFVLGVLADKPNISARLMREAITVRMPEKEVSTRTVERFLSRFKLTEGSLYTAIANPDAWKNKYRPAFGSYADGITRANQLWMLDSTPADILLEDGRHSLIGAIDVATHRFRLLVNKTSSADAVCRLTRRAIIEWGVPEAVKIDNGRDYASQRFAAMLTGLQIVPRFSTPFSPWEKPYIERAFRSFSHSLLTLLPGYIGHDVAEAQAIRARQSFADQLMKKNQVVEVRLTAEQFQTFCDKWCDEYHMHEPNRGEVMQGMTPFEKVASLRDTVHMVKDVRALDVLMGAGTMCTVQKKGIRYEKLNYIAIELGDLVGERVLVRRDEEGDIGRIVVYHRDTFLCIAECPEVTGVSRKEIAIESGRQAREEKQRLRRELRKAGKAADTASLAFDILDERARKNASLTAFPAPNVSFMTPQLEEAALAADALEAFDAGRPSEAQRAASFDGMVAVVREEQTADQAAEARFRDALDVLMKPADERNDLELARLRSYQLSAEFTARWDMFTEFGGDFFGLSDDYNALIPMDALFHASKGAF